MERKKNLEIKNLSHLRPELFHETANMWEIPGLYLTDPASHFKGRNYYIPMINSDIPNAGDYMKYLRKGFERPDSRPDLVEMVYENELPLIPRHPFQH